MPSVKLNLDSEKILKCEGSTFGTCKIPFSDLETLRASNQALREKKGVFISEKWDSNWYNVFAYRNDTHQIIQVRLAGIGNHVISEEPIGKIKVLSLFCQNQEILDPFEILIKDPIDLRIGQKDLDISGNSQELAHETDPKFADLTDEQLDAEI